MPEDTKITVVGTMTVSPNVMEMRIEPDRVMTSPKGMAGLACEFAAAAMLAAADLSQQSGLTKDYESALATMIATAVGNMKNATCSAALHVLNKDGKADVVTWESRKPDAADN